MKAGQVLVLLAAAALAGCQSMSNGPARATAGLDATSGNKTMGEVTFEQVGDKVRVTAQVIGLKPNQEHGFHIHEVGDCSSGDAMSAKGHFNPYGKPHGPQGSEHHAGDMPNVKADAKGRARLVAELEVVTMTSGPASIIGRGVIVHANPDDYTTQPTGNAGARLACGVIKAG
ncbi:MAG: superoxide dismutase family protein [Betaproteobacteria bacterium]|nr:superoxide dismutase family protein [Betaproteobacteria bacterium]